MTAGRAPDDLAARIQRLEDLEAVRQVMGEYVLAADDRRGFSVDVERTVALFADDGVWDGGERFGRHEGRDAVQRYLSRGKAGINWSLHSLANPRLEISADGQTAQGRWYLVEIARMHNAATNEPDMVWLSGVYDGDFVRTHAGWKIKVLKFDCQMIVGPLSLWPAPAATR